MPTISTYSIHEMMDVVRKLNTPNPFWLDLAFPRVQTFDTEFINFDLIDSGRRLAPFVMPTVAGRPIRQRGYITKQFKPAYIKMKDSVDPSRVIARMAGEGFGGTMSPEQRRDAIRVELLQEHRDQWARRMNWMAARAILDDSITISGEDYPTVVLSFGRPANQTLTLAGADLWSDAAKDPLVDIENWALLVQRSSGYSPTEVIMGLDAYTVFKNKQTVKDALDTEVRGTKSAIEIGPGNGQEVQYRGQLSGVYNIWTYSDIYEDETGAIQPFMDPKAVAMVARQGVDGVRCFGAIQDAELGYVPSDFASKTFLTDDPSVEWLLSQSAPLVVPRRSTATLRARVLT